ncbi:glycoside hydrolase family 88 protein [Hymenobacter sp. BT186]|uniref:Glycoside hydrolase family 88 protein n=1 Tax=Hymenobacter telluris TaxID=2816474 RepID=A0A939EX64_9BACT|nr:glycoside hydrolase family 88 protein [Hymenobacter telluris]MBO0359145.1 glycoside hydrolase family 88 protein [Hymenobacter telluris]MBW3375171.1 glycoside hydrolase family 88 protein [Hymenobacter norwichensis]
MKIAYPPYITAGLLGLALAATTPLLAQKTPAKTNDTTTPLHLLQPDYPVPYGKTKPEEVKQVLDRVYTYLNAATPAELVDKTTNATISTRAKFNPNAIIKPGDFRLTSYEWGVTYSGMLLAGEVTGDKKYTDYTFSRLKFLSELAPYYRDFQTTNPKAPTPMRGYMNPHALDDGGALTAAMIRAQRAGLNATELRPLIDGFVNYIMTKEFRLSDGTLARNRPQPNTLWLDDMYMSLPALAQMGKLTGEQRYYDEVVKQYGQFSQRMFNQQKGLYMHGWVQEMSVHPEFHWARANGWALMTTVDILDVLPENHPGRPAILAQLKAHAKGLAALQAGSGFWHQLLDRNDSYLETSATAIYAYAIAHGINQGWLDAKAYGPMALLAWNAVSTKVNSKGQVEGTCVGTGMGFDPAFYYYRPVNVYAAHGYGPVVLAGAEIIRLLKLHPTEINDSSVQLTK